MIISFCQRAIGEERERNDDDVFFSTSDREEKWNLRKAPRRSLNSSFYIIEEKFKSSTRSTCTSHDMNNKFHVYISSSIIRGNHQHLICVYSNMSMTSFNYLSILSIIRNEIINLKIVVLVGFFVLLTINPSNIISNYHWSILTFESFLLCGSIFRNLGSFHRSEEQETIEAPW